MRLAWYIPPLAALVATLPAGAADPPSGTLSNAAPRLTWTGEAAGYGTSVLADLNGSFVGPCTAPNCDSFALDVKDSGDLTVTLTSNEGTFMTMEIQAPDGTITYNGGAEDSAATTIRLRNAAIGAYAVRAQTNNTLIDDYGYGGVATLGSPPAPAPSPGATPAPTPAATPGPGARPGAQIRIRTRSASARRARRSLPVALLASAEVRRVVAELRRGKSLVARGTLTRLAGRATVKLKVRRAPKPGSYRLTVRAIDSASGAKVGTSVRFKFKP